MIHLVRIPTYWLLAASLIVLSGCESCSETPADTGDQEPTCTVEITAGRGTHHVTEKRAGRTTKAMRKVLFEKGCAKICEADGVAEDKRAACIVRCQADIVGDQVGVRFRCDG